MTENVKELTETLERISSEYAAKFSLERDKTWFMLKLQEEVGELTQAFIAMTGGSRPKGKTPEQVQEDLAAEVAVVYCHILLLAHHLDIDIATAVEEKWLQWS